MTSATPRKFYDPRQYVTVAIDFDVFQFPNDATVRYFLDRLMADRAKDNRQQYTDEDKARAEMVIDPFDPSVEDGKIRAHLYLKVAD